jgi:hypothetical protein
MVSSSKSVWNYLSSKNSRKYNVPPMIQQKDDESLSLKRAKRDYERIRNQYIRVCNQEFGSDSIKKDKQFNTILDITKITIENTGVIEDRLGLDLTGDKIQLYYKGGVDITNLYKKKFGV